MILNQGYAVEIFADTFSHEGQGLKSGERVDSVAYWSAVVMAGVRLGRNYVLLDKINLTGLHLQFPQCLQQNISPILAEKRCTLCQQLLQSCFK